MRRVAALRLKSGQLDAAWSTITELRMDLTHESPQHVARDSGREYALPFDFEEQADSPIE